MEEQADRAADQRAIDPYVLQIPADLQLHCPADFFGVPALHHIGDQAGYLVTEAHDHLMYGVQPPLIELLPYASLLEQCFAQYGQRASDVLFDQGRLALQVSLNPPPDVVPQQSVELFGLQMLDQFPQKRLPLLTILLGVHQVVNQVPHCLIELLAQLVPRVLHHFVEQRHDSLSKFVDHVTVQSTGRIAGRFAELGLDQTLLRDEPALQGLQRPVEQNLVPFAFCQHRQHVACYPRHVKAQQLRREGAIEELPDLLVLQPAQHHRNKIRDGRGYRKAVPARSQPPGKRLRRVVLPKLGGDVFGRQEVLFDEIAEALADPVQPGMAGLVCCAHRQDRQHPPEQRGGKPLHAAQSVRLGARLRLIQGSAAACFAADHGDQEASCARKLFTTGATSCARATRNRCPSSITYSFALGIRAARILALIRGTIGSSLPCMTSVGCRSEPSQGRLVQPHAANSW